MDEHDSDPRLDAPDRTSVEAVGQSDAFLDFQEQLSNVAKVDRPVLIIGERGTGKELAASRLHYLSKRWQAPFLALNCSALPASLIESELFGHEEGAFTGAARRRTGRFEAADGGTLFLDELGSIPLEVQEKILRVVEYGTFERVGGSRPVRVDVRIVGATNADLPGLVRSNRFKNDLLDRLSFEVLFLPPLRERRDDIMLLAAHFAARMAFELGCADIPQFTDEAIRILEEYPWPGNIRELKNVIERAVYRSRGRDVTAEDIVFNPFMSPYAPLPVSVPEWNDSPASDGPQESVSRPTDACLDLLRLPFREAVRTLEIRLLEHALRRAKYNQRRAAALLGLSYHQFRGLYRKHRSSLPAPE